MNVFPCFSSGDTSGQKAGQMATGTTRGSNVRPILEEGGTSTVHHLPVGTV